MKSVWESNNFNINLRIIIEIQRNYSITYNVKLIINEIKKQAMVLMKKYKNLFFINVK